MNFSEFGLNPALLKAIEEVGYTTPTPIQEQAIPYVLMARDLVGLAQTGTGKTASFTLPMIEILSQGRGRMRMPRSLVLTPTRELAAQVADNFDKYGKYHKLTKVLLVGGESMVDQIKIMEKGVDVLIATPGRLLDLFERGRILLTDVKVLVIDEADRMLDMGFIPDIEKIVSRLPATRQTLMFSATMSPEIKRLSEKFLSNPKLVSVAPPAPASTVQHCLKWVQAKDKKSALKKLIQIETVKNAFIFCNRKRDVDTLADWLRKNGFAAAGMHGDMVQSKRTETLQKFKDGEIILLVCSDVAARGLDVSGVSHVFNYDIPFNADDYIHRIGRTGRAGQTGKAWTLAVRDDDQKLVDAVEKLIGKPIETPDVGEVKAEEGADSATETAKPRHTNTENKFSRRPERRPEHKADRSESKPDQKPARAAEPRSAANRAPIRMDTFADEPRTTERAPARENPRPQRDTADNGPSSFTDDDMPAFLRR